MHLHEVSNWSLGGTRGSVKKLREKKKSYTLKKLMKCLTILANFLITKREIPVRKTILHDIKYVYTSPIHFIF